MEHKQGTLVIFRNNTYFSNKSIQQYANKKTCCMRNGGHSYAGV
jgi:hypothetical protein